jgi:arabinofuranosyltransferase
MNLRRSHIRLIYLLLVLSYILWAGLFIYKSSFIAIDGNRYFGLWDDGMISMRYAWNLSHGNGLVWNINERVEGYSNLLMTLGMSLMTWAFEKKYAVLAVQIAGIPTVLLSAFLAWRTTLNALRDTTVSGPSSLIVFFLVLAFYPLSYWSLMGMESGLIAIFILTSGLFLLEWEASRNPGALILSAVFSGLAFLTRNDAILFAGACFCYSGWLILKSGDRKSLRVYFTALLVYGIFVIGLLAFRWFYYGELVPNTYTLKLAGVPLSVRLNDGVVQVFHYLLETWPIYALAIASIFLIRNPWKWFYLAFSMMTLGYQVWIGGDALDRGRLIAPSIPFLLILDAISVTILGAKVLEFITARMATNPRPVATAYIKSLVYGIFVALQVAVIAAPYGGEIIFTREIPEHAINPHNMDLAIGIKAVTTPDASVGVFMAGLIPYYTDRYAIDYLGKSDRHIASLPPRLPENIKWFQRITVPGHNKYDLYYSLKGLHPTFTQSFHWGDQYLRAYVVRNYVRFRYTDVNGTITLQLAQDSPDIDWEKGEILPWGGP